MPLLASKILPSLNIETIISSINQFKHKQSEIPEITNLVPLKEAPITKKTKQKVAVATREELREKNNISRRDSVEKGLKLLEIKDIISNLDEIARGKNQDNYYGFKPTKQLNKDDAIIGQIAQGLSDVLSIYPSSQNIEAASGFIQMVDLIDDLEGVASEGEKGGFGFRSATAQIETPIQIQAAKSAREIRAKIPYILEWLEVPKYMPSRN